MVDITSNPLYFASAGGLLLGIATSLNYCLRGKVTGMSGIVYGILTLSIDLPQLISIVGGMLLSAGIFFDIFKYGTSNGFTPFGPADQIAAQTSYIGYAVAGLLVGFGTKMGNGCTSGHGLCGMPRFSIRSFVAVAVFLTTAIGISTLRYYESLGPFSSDALNPVFNYDHMVSANLCIAIGVCLPIIGAWGKIKKDQKQREEKQQRERNQRNQHQNQQNLIAVKTQKKAIMIDQLITFAVGIIFGSGLLVAGMVRRSNIIGFLSLGQNWNPSLLFVLGCGVIFNLVTFNYMLRVKKISFLGKPLFNPSNTTIDMKLIGGAFCFGLGWGIGGLCPGPAIAQFAVFTVPIGVIWMICLILGMLIAKKVLQMLEEKEKKQKQEQGITLNAQIAPPTTDSPQQESVGNNNLQDQIGSQKVRINSKQSKSKQ